MIYLDGMKRKHTAVSVYLISIMPLLGCAADGPSPAAGLDASQADASMEKESAKPAAAERAQGEIVADIGPSCWAVFQDRDDNYWFISDGNGVFRYRSAAGGAITQFTTKDGLAHDQVRGIEQHKPTGHILITTNGGVSRYDGQRFVTLPIVEMEPPALPLTVDSLREAGWGIDAGDVWLPGSAGPRRYDGRALVQLKFPKSPLEDSWRAQYPGVRWEPYDVWTVYPDRRGHVWFGTGGMGVCRFDGESLDWLYEQHLTDVGGGRWFGFRSIVEDESGDFWFSNTRYRYAIRPHGTTGQQPGLITYERRAGMDLAGSATTDELIYFQSIAADDAGNLWMAPYAGGVWRFDGTSVTSFPMKDAQGNEITMVSIFMDNRGTPWVSTHEHGAYRFNGTGFERFRLAK